MGSCHGYQLSEEEPPVLLAEAGAPGEFTYSREAGAMRVVLPGGETMTPGEAAERYLLPCGACGQVWPKRPH